MHRDEYDAGAPRRRTHGLPPVARELFFAWGALAAASLWFLVNTIAVECAVPVGPGGRCANGVFVAVAAFVVIGVPWIAVTLVLWFTDSL